MIGLLVLIGFGSAPDHADAVQSFVETPRTCGQSAAVNAGLDAYDPRVLSITFSAHPPTEPLPEPSENALIPEAESPPDNLFAFRFPSGDPLQQQAQPEAFAETPSTPPASVVPEPSSLVLLLVGVAGLAGSGVARWRRVRSRQ